MAGKVIIELDAYSMKEESSEYYLPVKNADEHLQGSCELPREQQCTDDGVIHLDCADHDEGLHHDCDQSEYHDDSMEKTDERLVERPKSSSKEELVPDGGWGWVIVFAASVILVSVNQISEILRHIK